MEDALTILLSPGRWAAVRQINGYPHLFTFHNPEGRGFETYTCTQYAIRHGVGVTLDGARVKFTKREMQKIRGLVA